MPKIVFICPKKSVVPGSTPIPVLLDFYFVEFLKMHFMANVIVFKSVRAWFDSVGSRLVTGMTGVFRNMLQFRH